MHYDAHAHRHFVAHHLGRFTHRAEQRPLRRRRVAGQNYAEDFDSHHGQDEEYAHIQIERYPAVAERQRQVSTERGAKADVGCDTEEHSVGPFGHQIFFGDQLQAVGQRLQPAEFTADARGAQPILDAAGHFALQPDETQGSDRDDVDQ
jgi:hypothetical protein